MVLFVDDAGLEEGYTRRGWQFSELLARMHGRYPCLPDEWAANCR